MARACNDCVADENLCKDCTRNPEYKHHYNYYKPYRPTCKFNEMYCIHDPAYIYRYDKEWYYELYGDKLPEELGDECKHCRNGEFYDDEDK
jgi:hypothetical protein